MKKYLLLCIAMFAVTFTGCASFWNDINSGKSMLGSYRGDYVVVNTTGGVIADVWVLENVLVESESGSDGWRFKDNNNMIHLGGDSKVIRIADEATLRLYREYHMEFETETYQEKYGRLGRVSIISDDRGSREVAARYHLRGRSSRFFRRSRRIG